MFNKLQEKLRQQNYKVNGHKISHRKCVKDRITVKVLTKQTLESVHETEVASYHKRSSMKEK